MKRLGLILLLLPACAPPVEEPAPEPLPGPPVDEAAAEGEEPAVDLILGPCGADEVQDLTGTPLAEAGERIPVDARVIAPGDVVTQDYRPKRMNVLTDDRGRIAEITCG